MKKLFQKEYSSESLLDASEDMLDAINEKSRELPVIENAPEFTRGTFKVTVEWFDENEEQI